MISVEFIRRSLTMLPVDSRAVIAASRSEEVAFGRLCAHYDTAMATLRAVVGPEDDDDGDDPETVTPLEEPEPVTVPA